MKRANGHRGPDKKPRKPGSGGFRGTAGAFSFRQWCRDVVTLPEVRKIVEERAKTDAEFALKVAEHGFGRAPQSLDVTVGGHGAGGSIVHQVVLASGAVVPAAVAGVSGAGAAEHRAG